MSEALRADLIPDQIPVTPDMETWRSMSELERARFIEDATAALQEAAELMAEGLPHSRSKFGVQSVLGDFFERIGRKVFLASELPVFYPGERALCPDIIAVLDVADHLEDRRMGWVVAAEGRGVDLALEVLHSGNRRKDLYDNVVEYARVGIPEYFVFDRLNGRLHGYRLPEPFARVYQPIRSRGGLTRSEILDLDLAVVDGRLQFQYGGAVVPETRELLARVSAMVEELEQKAAAEAAVRAELEQKAAAEAAVRAELERRVAALEARIAELQGRA